MPGTPTTRRSLPTLDAAHDNVSAYPATNLVQMDNLDSAMDYLESTLVLRPLASAVLAGTVHRATDLTVGQWSQSDGTNWLTAMLAGAWTNLTLPTNIVAFAFSGTPETPAARLVGDTVELRGSVKNNTGSAIAAGGTIFTVPAGLRPAADRIISPPQNALSVTAAVAYPLIVPTTGVAISAGTGNGPFAIGNVIHLDGVSYPA